MQLWSIFNVVSLEFKHINSNPHFFSLSHGYSLYGMKEWGLLTCGLTSWCSRFSQEIFGSCFFAFFSFLFVSRQVVYRYCYRFITIALSLSAVLTCASYLPRSLLISQPSWENMLMFHIILSKSIQSFIVSSLIIVLIFRVARSSLAHSAHAAAVLRHNVASLAFLLGAPLSSSVLYAQKV